MTKRFRNIYSNAFNFLHKGPKLIRNTNKTKITLSNFRQPRKASTADTAMWSEEEVIQFDIFLNVYSVQIMLLSTLMHIYPSGIANKQPRQAKVKWPEGFRTDVFSFLGADLVHLSDMCSLHIRKYCWSNQSVHESSDLFFPSPNVLVFLDLCQWCHRWVSNSWLPEFPWGLNCQRLCLSWKP